MEEMPKIKHTVRRGSTYYLRVRIPQDLMEFYNFRKEITKSLKTGDPKSARSLSVQEHAKIMREFDKKRLEQNPPPANDEDMLSKYSDAQLLIPVFEWLAEQEKINDQHFLASEQEAFGEEHDLKVIDLESERGFYEDSLRGKTEEDYGASLAVRELKKQNITFDKKSKAFRRISTLFSEALIENTEKSIRRLKRENVPEYINPRFKNLDAQQSNKTITFGELIDEYVKENEENWTGSRTKKSRYFVFEVCKEVIPENTSITDVDRKACRKIQKTLVNLPTNMRKSYPKEKYTFKEAYKQAEKDGKEKISANTANGYITTLASLMKYASDEDYIAKSPAKGLLVKDDTPDKDKRYPFTQTQLQQIFSAPLYTGCKDLKRDQNKPGNLIPRDTAKFWAPLLSLWTGMRMGECLQLEYGDIGKENDIHVIYIRESEETKEAEGKKAFEKRVKNRFSIRYIPIHPELKKLGFLEFVKSLEPKKETRLFPEITGYDGNLTHAFSKWFGGTFLKHNIEGRILRKTVFHSFRHNYRDAMRRADIREEISCALGGWSANLGVQGDYGGEYDPEHLYSHVEKIDYPHLDLSHLHIRPKSRKK